MKERGNIAICGLKERTETRLHSGVDFVFSVDQ